MKMTISKMTIKNFKGIKEQTIDFNGKNVRLLGQNASFKTSTSDAFYWLFADTNTALVKNPPITPLGMPECESKVEIDLLVDDKPLTLAKRQVFKSKEVDGKITSSVVNKYEINSVDKTLRDFTSDLMERGIDLSNFQIFSHPNAFTNDTSKQGRENMRNLLFGMCDGFTDLELANLMDGVDDLKTELVNYKLDEIEQMNKATIKKITETMGKDNSIVSARIDELLSQKSDKDIKVLESQKMEYESEINRIDSELANISSSKAEISTRIAELKAKKDKMIIDANAKLDTEKAKFSSDITNFNLRISELRSEIVGYQDKIARSVTRTEQISNKLLSLREEYKQTQNRYIDENEFVCPVCHREYEQEKVAKIKADFEKNKTNELESISELAKGYKDESEQLSLESAKYSELAKDLNKELLKVTDERDALTKKIASLPPSADMSGNKEYKAIVDEINVLMAELSKEDNTRKEELESQKNFNKQMLSQVMSNIGIVDKNNEIDKRINELKEDRAKAEINRANAEKMLNQVEIFKREKNNKLSDRINSYFEGVEFRLFKTLKNGKVEEALDVLIDGKEIYTQLNQASQVLAKLNIIKGLSNYYNITLPVFIDDASLLTANTVSKIDMNNQLIFLCASDLFSTLTIERMD